MNKKEKVLAGLTVGQKEAAIDHFNKIYVCDKLGERENRIIYLSWLWANGYIFTDQDSGMLEFSEKEAGVPLNDYEIDLEDDNRAGVNLHLTCSFYDVNTLAEILHLKEGR